MAVRSCGSWRWKRRPLGAGDREEHLARRTLSMNRVSRASPSPPSNAGVKSLKATNIPNVDEGRAIYWSNSRFPRTRRSPQARRGGGNQCLFNTRAHAPAHFPEVGLEPGRFLKNRDQLGLARGRDIEIGKAVQVRMRLRCDLLVWRTGILVDPDAIGVRCGARIGSRCEPCRDLRVADHAG